MIDFIEQNHGWKAVIDLIDPESGYESVLGYDRREFYDRWTSSLRRDVANPSTL